MRKLASIIICLFLIINIATFNIECTPINRNDLESNNYEIKDWLMT